MRFVIGATAALANEFERMPVCRTEVAGVTVPLGSRP